MGPDHDRSGRHAGSGQARRQHMVDDAGRSLRHHASGSPATTREASPATRPLRAPFVSPTVCGPTGALRRPRITHRRPDGLSPPHPRGHDARASRMAGQRLLQFIHRVAVPEASSTPRPAMRPVGMYYKYGGSFIGTMTETNRYVRAYREGKIHVRGQPVDLVRGRGQVRRYHPAGLHQLRALGHRGVGLSYRCRRLGGRCLQPPAHRPGEEVHRTARRVEVRLRDLLAAGRTTGLWVSIYTQGGTPISTGSGAFSMPATSPRASPGRTSCRRATTWCRSPRTESALPPCAGSRRTGCVTRRIWGPNRATLWGSRGSGRLRARSSSWRPASSASTSRRHRRSRAPGHGPAVHSQLGRASHHRTGATGTRCSS